MYKIWSRRSALKKLLSFAALKWSVWGFMTKRFSAARSRSAYEKNIRGFLNDGFLRQEHVGANG